MKSAFFYHPPCLIAPHYIFRLHRSGVGPSSWVVVAGGEVVFRVCAHCVEFNIARHRARRGVGPYKNIPPPHHTPQTWYEGCGNGAGRPRLV